jgi:hypothetical protein
MGASDVLVAQQGHSLGKVVVLMLSLAQLANRLHLNIRAISQTPSLTKRLLQTCSYLRCKYQARRFSVS